MWYSSASQTCRCPRVTSGTEKIAEHQEVTNMQVGFIGLGTMGASMAANLQKAGYKLVVNDVRREAAAPHLKAGAVWAATPREVAANSQVIFTSLPGPPEVEAVALGPDGVIEVIGKDAAYFDLSTNARALVL